MNAPSRTLRAAPGIALVLALLAGALPAARAQDTCRTPACAALGSLPPDCQNRAAPRTPLVRMTTSGVNFVFEPSQPKIEPDSCVEWVAATAVHSSSESACTDDSLCGSPPSPACLWDTGNVSSTATNPSVVCHYDSVSFPPAGAEAFYCRIHASPTTGTMRGTLRVTTAIDLTVDKDVSDVVLSWTGGGVPGDETFKVVRSDTGDPTFPAAGSSTFDPAGGAAGRTFRDAGELANGLTRYYLIRNRQSNE